MKLVLVLRVDRHLSPEEQQLIEEAEPEKLQELIDGTLADLKDQVVFDLELQDDDITQLLFTIEGDDIETD